MQNVELKRDKSNYKAPVLKIKEECFSSKKNINKLKKLSNMVSNYNDFWLHKVSKNDTLKSISIKYFSNEEYWIDIYNYNTDRIPESKIIKEGQIIRIPTK